MSELNGIAYLQAKKSSLMVPVKAYLDEAGIICKSEVPVNTYTLIKPTHFAGGLTLCDVVDGRVRIVSLSDIEVVSLISPTGAQSYWFSMRVTGDDCVVTVVVPDLEDYLEIDEHVRLRNKVVLV